MKNQKSKIVGLTGGLASGKTLVLKEFKKLGIKTISCDDIAKKIYNRTNVRKCIKKHFGTLNRKKIAEIIFSNTNKKKILEKILHPAIIKDLKNRLSSIVHRPSHVIVDAPLLFEANIEQLFDKIIVVYCRKKQQVRRLCIRDNIPAREAIKRIESQIALKKKLKWADYIIDNTGKKQTIARQAKDILFGSPAKLASMQDSGWE